MANGNKVTPLGKVKVEMEIDEDMTIPIVAHVIESGKEDLLLGSEWFVDMKGNIDFGKRKLTVEHKDEKIEIPIYFTRNEDIESESSEESSEENNTEESENEYEKYEENEELEAYQVDEYEKEMWEEIKDKKEEERTETYLNNENDENDENDEEFNKNLRIGKVDKGQGERIKKIVGKYRDLCVINTAELGRTDIVRHRINTGDHGPIKGKPYRVDNEDKRKIIKNEIEKMEKAGVIRKSYSPWSSPVVIVEKKDGSKRFCVDYRKINQITIPDAHPLPRIDDMLEQFETAKWFTSIDLASGYWQIAMEKEDIQKTAFTCGYGLYEFVVMPFGLTNAPATFQRLMNHILMEYLDEFVVVYIDDILIYSKTFDEHLKHLERVFEKLKEAKLMIKLKKCKFGEQNIEFLGHIIGRDGIKPDPEKIEKIKNLKAPNNLTELRSVLGLCSYYRRFVKNFSKIVKPLNKLLKKHIKYEWTKEQQKALEILKQKLIEYPILIQPDFEKPFILAVDASGNALGAVLSQLNEEGNEAVIAYASRTMNSAEQNYPITEQECLAVVWGIEHFHKYLMNRKFTVITDHSALKGLTNMKVIPKGRRARWLMNLQRYNFEIKHKPGKSNKNADALSRL